MSSPLEEIPGVGPRIAAVMEALGIQAVSDLAGADPEELYRRECLMKGFQEDRCCLLCVAGGGLLCRAPRPEAEKLKWWYWKNRPYPPEEGEKR